MFTLLNENTQPVDNIQALVSAKISPKLHPSKHIHGSEQVLIYCTQILTPHCGHPPAS